ncbi:MAG: DUF86 domain-containing protein [Chloroflexi bacterium]|nr:DUF86 domain-containing protein [Chloroflexota bacterium]
MQRDHEHDRLHLLHMRDAAYMVLEVAQDRNRADLDGDIHFQLALVKAVELVGESAYQVSKRLRAESPHIPWQDIVDMRHVLVHNYWRVEMDVVWDTVKNDIPSLITQLQQLIDSEAKRNMG